MKQTLADTAYNHLTDLILTNVLKAGDRIPEQDVIDSLNISRTPVREAIRRLAADGLIDFNPGTFALVHTFSEKEMSDMGSVRITVDCLASQLAIVNGSNRDFQSMISLAADCQRASDNGDLIERIRLDCEFHTMLSQICGNKELLAIQQRLNKRSRLMQLQAYNQEGSSFCDLAGHLDIINGLMNRDVEACLKAIQNHLKHFYSAKGSDNNAAASDPIKTYIQFPVFNLE